LPVGTPGGSVVAEWVADRGSLNMLIEFGDAFDFCGADFRKWCGEVGFKSFEVLHLAGPSSAAIAYESLLAIQWRGGGSRPGIGARVSGAPGT